MQRKRQDQQDRKVSGGIFLYVLNKPKYSVWARQLRLLGAL
jgi:hypothetical protein